MDDGIKKSLDLLGFLCPIPVHETRRVLKDCGHGDRIEVICDDPETLHDIPALCDRLGVVLESVEEKSGEYRFVISNEVGDL
jgi:TusA-related sulfurtransferase|tara:strand:+ start:451 stop:696 length:246 start_codon:yes stop_codon:yes gene_type:complete